MKTEEMDFRDFTSVDAGYACEVEIARSDSYSVNITAGDNLIKSVKVDKQDGTLRIRRTLSSLRGLIPGTFQAKITMPVLERVDLSGASKLTGQAKGADAEFNLNGASRVELEGSANKIVADAAGASHVDLASFHVSGAKIKLSGASHTTLNIDGQLDANLSGASKLYWLGKPVMGDIRMAGASTMSRK